VLALAGVRIDVGANLSDGEISPTVPKRLSASGPTLHLRRPVTAIKPSQRISGQEDR